MDHMKILSRAFDIVRRYRALWVLGFLFVLCGGAGGFNGNGGGGSNSGYRVSSSEMANVNWNMVLIIAAIAVVVLILLAVIATSVRYVAEAGLIAGVDEIESNGETLTVRRGWRLGWSRQAWRLFLTNLAIGLPVAVGVLILLALAASPLLLLLVEADVVRVIGVGLAVVLILTVILFTIAVALALSVIKPYIHRRVVLGKRGVLASIREGLALVRASLGDTALMWLLLIAVGIAWAIVKIPIIVVLVVLSLVVGGLPAGLAYLISHSWIVAAIVGTPLFLVVLIPVASFIEGLFQAYLSTTWTLTYRQVMSQHSDLMPVSNGA